jgi:putative endonuclease
MGGYVYIIANRKHGALYTGVTAEISQRIVQHRDGEGSEHASKYEIYRLVYVECYEDVSDAIVREKRIKKWRRAWKVELLEKTNPNWRICFSISTVEDVVGPGGGSPLSRG